MKPLLALSGLLAASCVSPSSVAVDPDVEPVTYYVSEDPQTVRTEREYTGSGETVLGYVEHRGEAPRAAIVYLHGIESHGGWFAAAADGLCARGFDVFCLDRRGSGINRENRGLTSGYVDRYETLFADIRAFMEQLEGRYEHVFLVGLSWGGKLALAYALEHPDDAEALVLITPGLVATVDLRWHEKLGVFFGTAFWPRSQIRTPIQPEMFTTTPEWLELIEADPLRLRRASARFFWQSRALDGLVDDRVEENRLPILLFLADGDVIVDNEEIVELLERGSQDLLDVRTYADQTHSIQFDDTDRLVADMAAWFEERMQASP